MRYSVIINAFELKNASHWENKYYKISIEYVLRLAFPITQNIVFEE